MKRSNAAASGIGWGFLWLVLALTLFLLVLAPHTLSSYRMFLQYLSEQSLMQGAIRAFRPPAGGCSLNQAPRSAGRMVGMAGGSSIPVFAGKRAASAVYSAVLEES